MHQAHRRKPVFMEGEGQVHIPAFSRTEDQRGDDLQEVGGQPFLRGKEFDFSEEGLFSDNEFAMTLASP